MLAMLLKQHLLPEIKMFLFLSNITSIDLVAFDNEKTIIVSKSHSLQFSSPVSIA